MYLGTDHNCCFAEALAAIQVSMEQIIQHITTPMAAHIHPLMEGLPVLAARVRPGAETAELFAQDLQLAEMTC